MILRFCSGSATPASAARNSLLASTWITFTPRFSAKVCITCSAFVQAQQAVVHEHAGQLIADGAMDQRRRHRRIHAAGQARGSPRRCPPSRIPATASPT